MILLRKIFLSAVLFLFMFCVASIYSSAEDDYRQAILAGGLLIIGTERHESRRIDNQLRGRSGRQGDIGESIFYLSLEDSGGSTFQHKHRQQE